MQLQYIIQMSTVSLTTVYTVGYWLLCLVTVVSNSETQLFFSYANSTKETVIIAPQQVQMWAQPGLSAQSLGCFFNKCLRFSEIGAGLEPALWVSHCWHVPTFSAQHFSTPLSFPLFFQQGGWRVSMLSFFDSVWIWPHVSRKRSQTCFLSGPGGKRCNKQGVGG